DRATGHRAQPGCRAGARRPWTRSTSRYQRLPIEPNRREPADVIAYSPGHEARMKNVPARRERRSPQLTPCSDGRVADDRHTLHDAALWKVVRHRVVLDRAVVPE